MIKQYKSLIKCPICEAIDVEDTRYCKNCWFDFKLRRKTKVCVFCKERIGLLDDACPSCGKAALVPCANCGKGVPSGSTKRCKNCGFDVNLRGKIISLVKELKKIRCFVKDDLFSDQYQNQALALIRQRFLASTKSPKTAMSLDELHYFNHVLMKLVTRGYIGETHYNRITCELIDRLDMGALVEE
jgi:predicted RNA-binding Zn-ribbon protein involved in translation (DUF1610 family)